MNYDRLIADIRLDLDNPDQHSPTDDAIMLAIADMAQLFNVRAQNMSEAWSVNYQDLPISAGNATYALSMMSFGKPVRIHTIDPGNAMHYTRKIDIVDRQDIENYYSGVTGPYGGAAGDDRWNAACAVVYWTNGQPLIEFIPVPSASCQYRIWAESGAIDEPARGAPIPVQDPFHRYVRLRAAIALLGKCHWSRLLGSNAALIDPERVIKIMSSHAERQRNDLTPHALEYKEAYEEYIANSQQSGDSYGNPYAGWLESWY